MGHKILVCYHKADHVRHDTKLVIRLFYGIFCYCTFHVLLVNLKEQITTIVLSHKFVCRRNKSIKMENNNYDNKKLKELSADELQEIFRQRKEKLEQIEELARRRGINLTEIQHSTLSNNNSCLNTCSLRTLLFSVKALCLRTYGFQRFFSNSLICCLSSGATLGDSNRLGNTFFLYFS